MDSPAALKTFAVAAIAAALGYLTYTRAGLTAGMITTFMAAWILFQFRSVKSTWSSLGNFQNPVLFGINCSFATYIYAAWKGVPGGNIPYLCIAAFMLGGAASLMIHKYWNIGG